MGSRRWMFVTEPAKPMRPAWRFSLGYLASLAVIVGFAGYLMR